MIVSDRTLAELIAARLRSRRAFRLFAMRLGPHDVVYTSALAWSEDGRVLEVRASAEQFEDALVQLFANLELAVDERATETLLDREIDRPGPRPELELELPRALQRTRPRASERSQSSAPDAPAPVDGATRLRRLAIQQMRRRVVLTAPILVKVAGDTIEECEDVLEQLAADGILRVDETPTSAPKRRRGLLVVTPSRRYVAGERFPHDLEPR